MKLSDRLFAKYALMRRDENMTGIDNVGPEEPKERETRHSNGPSDHFLSSPTHTDLTFRQRRAPLQHLQN